MKKLAEAIPFALLLGLVPFFYYNSPNIAQSIIILGVSALCGYRYYCMDKIKPDYVEIFKEEFDAYKAERDADHKAVTDRHEKAMVYLENKVKELNTNYGKTTMEQATNKKTKYVF